MSKSKTLTIQFDSDASAYSFINDISELIYYNDQEREVESRCYQGPDDSEQIGFSWDGVTFWSANDADRQMRQEVYGNTHPSW